MEKGINLAVEESKRAIFKQDKDRSKICFFISHKYEDTEAAIEIGNHIMKDFGYNIYLDANDLALKDADDNNDFEKIVSLIQNGILYASHLLCVVTEKSKLSWWISYEIGYAQANKVKTSSLKVNKSEELPTFLKINNSPVFNNIQELDDYLSKNGKYGDLFTKYNYQRNKTFLLFK